MLGKGTMALAFRIGSDSAIGATPPTAETERVRGKFAVALAGHEGQAWLSRTQRRIRRQLPWHAGESAPIAGFCAGKI